MTNSLHNNEELMMRYLDGEMDASEKADFEKRLENDTALKAQLDSLQLAVATVRQYGATQKVQSIHKQMMQELSSVRKSEAKVVPMRKIVRYGLAVAASLVIILVGVNIFSSSSLSPEKLYNEAFVDYKINAVRGDGQLTQLEELYKAQKFDVITYEANRRDKFESGKFNLLTGLSFLKLNQPQGAIRWFRFVNPPDSNYQDAEFYLALAYVKNKNYKEALPIVEKIHSDKTHVYHGQFSDGYVERLQKLSLK